MNGHPYRELEQPKRGPLTRGEKLALGFRGFFIKMEPFLEQHRFGLDPKNCLPLDERAKHARAVAAKDSTDNLFKMIQAETDASIRSHLVQGFVRAFRRKHQELKDSIGASESGIAAIYRSADKEAFLIRSIVQTKDLIGLGHIGLDEGRRLVLEMGGME